MSPYLRVALLELGVGVGTFVAALAYVRLLLWAGEFAGRLARISLALVAYGGLATMIAAPLLAALSSHELRAFSATGWWPDLWLLMCYACAVAPTLWYISVRRGRDLEDAGWYRKES